MNDFHKALNYINEKLYKPNNLKVTEIQEEKQNSKYGAGIFKLEFKSIRFRVAHVTPTKIGQFVAIWEKDKDKKNIPFSYEKAPDLLVINTFKNETEFGQFVFPKDLLLKKNILSSNSNTGKMAIRVYPVWDKPTSKQAMQTQTWQLPYFVDMSNPGPESLERLKKLYLL
ncbi:MAG: MepB family protein [Erysipelothrix sp.]|nr:MepB family protein [Erysipelothrix sp.]